MIERVHSLAAGYCTHPEGMTRVGAPLRPCRFPSGFALIVHKRAGPILFDTGYAPRFADATRRFPERGYRLLTPVEIEEPDTARSQLIALGISPSDVRMIVVSHFHADHIAGLRDFPNARIHATRAAWTSVSGRTRLGSLLRGHLPALLPGDIEDRLTFVDDAASITLPKPLSAFGRARDLFGDRSILAVDLPGHAVGQIGLALLDAPAGPWFFVADGAWSRTAIERAQPPPRITTAFLGDTRRYILTLHALTNLERADASLKIIPSHDHVHERHRG